MRSLGEIRDLRTSSSPDDWFGKEARLEIAGIEFTDIMTFTPDPRIALAFSPSDERFVETWAVQPPDASAYREDSHFLVSGVPAGPSDGWVSVDGHRYLVPLPEHESVGQDGEHHRWSITQDQRKFATLVAAVMGSGSVEEALAKCGIGVQEERDGDVYASYTGKKSAEGEGYEGPIELGWDRRAR